MSFTKNGASAFGKLFVVIALTGTFLVGLVGVVYMSLQGEEIKVPDIVGKDFAASEDELAALGLRIKKRADRFSSEKPNTILEQLPKAGETVKTGQMILVVRSQASPDGEEEPVTIKKNEDEDDSEKIEELISDRPKKITKTNSNSNKKKTSTTRDVISNKSDNNSNDNSSDDDNSNKKESNANDNSSKGNKNSATNSNKPVNPTNSNKQNPAVVKPTPSKTPSGGDARPGKKPQP
ncbi:hypothetical protein BH24ACI2_BH24ACI2_10970 [soil metagenome]|nr:PASTA domain-containing protein [Acidobacteriota bacterium]